jgi:hypothetical protein
MVKQICLIALVAIGVTALFFGASIALAQAQADQAAALALRRANPGLACGPDNHGCGYFAHNPHAREIARAAS